MPASDLRCAFFCAKHNEFDALVSHFVNCKRRDAADGTVYSTASIPSERDGGAPISCAIHRTDIGQVVSSFEVQSVLRDFKPHIAIFVEWLVG
jgi:hypothetical protein